MERRTTAIARAIALGLLAGCGGPQNYMYPEGPAAGALASLGWLVLTLFTVVTVVVWAMIVWLALRRRGSFAEHAPIDDGGGQNWILIGGFAIPTAVLVFVFVLTVQAMDAFPMEHGHDGPAEMRVVGQQWWFNVEYLFDDPSQNVSLPTEIHIPAGRPVTIELQSRDVIHCFWVPKLHGKVDLVPGIPNVVRLMADRPGVYPGECAEFCGVQRAGRLPAEPAVTPLSARRGGRTAT